MSEAPSTPTRGEPGPQPAWDVAHLFPDQGAWSEEEYLALNTNRLVEYSHGSIEVLSMPTTSHQLIVAYIYGALLAFVSAKQLGMVVFAPLRVRLWPGKFREPDVVFALADGADRVGEEFWEGADLVVEVLSEDRRHDLETKRREYAQAGISEYWIADPQQGRITVLRLEGTSYRVHGEFSRGERASSVLLPGWTVDVAAALAGRP